MVKLPTLLVAATLASGFLSTSPALLAAQVTASMESTTVPAGEPAALHLEISGGRVDHPQFPKVAGVEFSGPINQSSSYNLINGVASQSLQLTYGVIASAPGEYDIPPIIARVDGVESKTQAFKLKVTPSANQVPKALLNAGKTPPAILGGSANAQLSIELGLNGGREYGSVGEIAPVCIQAWLPEGVNTQLTGGLTPEGTAFTLHNLSSKFTKRREVVNGRPWFVATWCAGLSAAKAGSWLPDLSVKAVQAVADPNSRPDIFGRRQAIRQELVLSSKDGDGKPIEVRALPRQGRPKDFGGAVGKFSLQSANLPAEWKTGEPQQVIAVIAGEGNFNLLTQPVLRPEESWKVHEGKSDFQALDRGAFEGTQKWQFSAVARKAGDQPLSLALDYFDPEAGNYRTIESVAQTVKVTGAATAPDTALTTAGEAPEKREPADLLAGLHDSDSSARNLTPLAFRPVFRLVLGICGGGALAGILTGIFRARRRDPLKATRAAVEKATRAALHEADSFAACGDVTGFFAAARRALQTKLSALWSCPAQAITLADVSARVPGDSPVAEIFREADRVEYGRDDTVDLSPWRSRLHSAMNSLTA